MTGYYVGCGCVIRSAGAWNQVGIQYRPEPLDASIAETGLDLRSHQHLDWMVVAPDGKIAIKGTVERIPGQYVGFVFYGFDGCPAGQTRGCQSGPDRLRLIAWDTTAYGPVSDDKPLIYDNRPGAPFDVDVADPQAINAGTILIQHPPIG